MGWWVYTGEKCRGQSLLNWRWGLMAWGSEDVGRAESRKNAFSQFKASSWPKYESRWTCILEPTWRNKERKKHRDLKRRGRYHERYTQQKRRERRNKERKEKDGERETQKTWELARDKPNACYQSARERPIRLPDARTESRHWPAPDVAAFFEEGRGQRERACCLFKSQYSAGLLALS